MLDPRRYFSKKPRRLARDARLASGTWSSRRINAFASVLPCATSYLEVGVQHGLTLEAVQLPFRWAVDPYPLFRCQELPPGVIVSDVESDDYFSELNMSVKFDMVFLDGLHEWKQTYRDLVHALEHSHAHTLVMIDDVVPSDEFSALPNEGTAIEARRNAGLRGLEWHGDVFKVMLAIRDWHPELRFAVVDNRIDNVQAIVWREAAPSPKQQNPPALPPDAADVYDEISYEDVFEDGAIPGWFNPLGEEEAVKLVADAILGNHRDG